MIERYLKSRRKYFKYDVDEDIVDLMPYFHEKNVEVIVVNSPSARNEIVREKDGKWVVIWDTFYWKYFEQMVILLMSIYSDENVKEDYELKLDYLEAVLYEFLSIKYKYNYPQISLCFAKQGLSNKHKYLEIDYDRIKSVDAIIKMAKIDLLSHELGHIYIEKDKQLEDQVTNTVKEYLTYLNQIEGIYGEISEDPEMRKVLNDVPDFIQGKNTNYLYELVDDAYSYVEGLDFVTNHLEFKEIAALYTQAALLLRDYNRIVNSADGIVKTCLNYQNEDVDIDNPLIKATNYINFFRYTLYSPLILFFLTQLYKDYGISYEEFSEITNPIHEFQELYNRCISPRVDNILRREMPYLVQRVLEKKNLKKCDHIDEIVEFLFEDI